MSQQQGQYTCDNSTVYCAIEPPREFPATQELPTCFEKFCFKIDILGRKVFKQQYIQVMTAINLTLSIAAARVVTFYAIKV